MKKINIALLGYGTIGKGVFEICSNNEYLNIVKILEKEEKFDKQIIELFTNDVNNIVNDNNIDLVVEVLGGYEFAKSCIVKCLNKGKHVVTANKEIIAKDIEYLVNLAKDNNCHIAYEASVGGGIPIIKNIKELKKINKITKITGILNGTTNFILTKMFEGMSFNEALKLAQKLGFAEADPTADLEGYDMMRKIAILSDLAWDTFIDINNVLHRGITSIKDEDIQNAKNNNQTIKFVCESIKEDNHISISVKPVVLENGHFLQTVNNEFNAVILETYPNDTLTFIGKGAGSLPTASAVVLDIIDIIEDNYLIEYQNINKFDIN
jgi:homoserine dehydrogenase